MGIQKNRQPTIAPNSDGDMVDVTSGAGGIDDTASETSTGLLDLAGDALFAKTLTLAANTTGTDTIAHGITGLKRMRSLTGSIQEQATGKWFPIPYASGSANIGIQIGVGATNIEITPGSFWGAGQLILFEITLLYTKV